MVGSVPLYQVSNNIVANDAVLRELREEESELKGRVPMPQVRAAPGNFLDAGKIELEAAPSYESIRGLIFPREYFLWCQRYVQRLLSLQPGTTNSARDRVLWVLDLMTRINDGLLALNLHVGPAGLDLHRDIRLRNPAGVQMFQLAPFLSTELPIEVPYRGAGATPPLSPRRFLNFPIGHPMQDLTNQALQRVRDRGGRFPDVAQVNAIHADYVQAEQQAWESRNPNALTAFSTAVFNQWDQIDFWGYEAPSGLNRLRDGQPPYVPAFSVPIVHLGYMPWVRGGTTEAYRTPLAAPAAGVDASDHQDWIHAQSSGDWIYNRAQQQWRIFASWYGTSLRQFIEAVNQSGTAIDMERRVVGTRFSWTPNFNFFMRYTARAYGHLFSRINYEVEISRAVQMLLPGGSGSHLGLSQHDCELLARGARELQQAGQDQALAVGAGVIIDAWTMGGSAGGPSSAEQESFAGSLAQMALDPEEAFGLPMAQGCPMYGGCANWVPNCRLATGGPFMRTLAQGDFNIIPNNELPSADMWLWFFISLANNERVGRLDFGFDLCLPDGTCLWDRAMAEAARSPQPPPPAPRPPSAAARLTAEREAARARLCDAAFNAWLHNHPDLADCFRDNPAARQTFNSICFNASQGRASSQFEGTIREAVRIWDTMVAQSGCRRAVPEGLLSVVVRGMLNSGQLKPGD